jgi:hypothetical protein
MYSGTLEKQIAPFVFPSVGWASAHAVLTSKSNMFGDVGKMDSSSCFSGVCKLDANAVDVTQG